MDLEKIQEPMKINQDLLKYFSRLDSLYESIIEQSVQELDIKIKNDLKDIIGKQDINGSNRN